MPDRSQNVHGTALSLGDRGLLIRGPSGAGKSLLALQLLDRFGSEGCLVSDDRVELVLEQGELLMSPPDAIAGLIELRGRGIVERPYSRSVHLSLVVDMVEDLVRMPEPEAFFVELSGLMVPRCFVPTGRAGGFGHQLLLIEHALGAEVAMTGKT